MLHLKWRERNEDQTCQKNISVYRTTLLPTLHITYAFTLSVLHIKIIFSFLQLRRRWRRRREWSQVSHWVHFKLCQINANGRWKETSRKFSISFFFWRNWNWSVFISSLSSFSWRNNPTGNEMPLDIHTHAWGGCWVLCWVYLHKMQDKERWGLYLCIFSSRFWRTHSQNVENLAAMHYAKIKM